MEPASASSDKESSLLKTAEELSSLLAINFRPRTITWMGTLERIVDLPSDQCYFVDKGRRRGAMIVPSELRGKLEPQEWRPLVASSLAYLFRPEIRRVWSTSSQLLVGVIFGTCIGVPMLILFDIAQGWGLSLSAIALLLVALIAVVFLSRLLLRANRLFVLRRLHLKGDLLAAGIVGKSSLVQTLEKIDAMKILDLENAKQKRRTIWKREDVSSFPTISERIANLQR